HGHAFVHGGPAGEVAGGVGGGVAVGVEAGDGIVEDVAVEVEGLGIGQVGVGDGLGELGPIGAEEAAEACFVVAGAERVSGGQIAPPRGRLFADSTVAASTFLANR